MVQYKRKNLGEKNMKFIHCADLHLDSAFSSLPREIAKIRKEEILTTFEKLCDYATENVVRAVIIAGDTFDTSKVTLKVKSRFYNAIRKNGKVDFLYLSGNHDMAVIDEQDDIPPNLKIFTDSQKTFEYENVSITGVNFNAFNGSSVYDTLRLDKNRLNVVVMHGQVAGYKSNEKAQVISLPRLKDKGIDYLALGHIHEYSKGTLDDRGEFAYSGCLDGRGFDETGDKGFVLLETSGNKIESKFVKFCSRVLREVSFDVTSFNSQFEILENLEKFLTENFSERDLIKVLLVGERSVETDVDKDFIASKLLNKFFYIKAYDKTNLKINVSDFEDDKSIRGEFVRAVLGSDKTEEEKKQIILCGLKALRGEI